MKNLINNYLSRWYHPGADPRFKVREGTLKKLRHAEGGANICGVLHVKNHDFTPKKIIFFPIAEGGAKIVGGISYKNHDFTPKIFFFQFYGGGGGGRVRAPPPPPPGSAPAIHPLISIFGSDMVYKIYIYFALKFTALKLCNYYQD